MLNEIQEALKKRYPNLHPLIFQRSLEKARTNGELFDILDSIPVDKYPLKWCEDRRIWEFTEDLLQVCDQIL
jgi:hypothetical protein